MPATSSVKIVNGDALTQVKLEQVPNPKEREFRRKPIAFNGEQAFTSMLLAVTSAKPFKAYFLQGHGEPSLSDTDETGYLKFGSILAQNYIAVTNLELFGDNPMPMDCNLLIIAGPRTELSETELQKIDQYLAQGGRLFVLFNYFSIKRPTGLEPILAALGCQCRLRLGSGSANNRLRQGCGCFQFQPASGGQSADWLRIVSYSAAAHQHGELGKPARRRAAGG